MSSTPSGWPGGWPWQQVRHDDSRAYRRKDDLMFMPYFPPRRLHAWRRSRCWKCDNKMSQRDRRSWFCRHCVHLVTYGNPT